MLKKCFVTIPIFVITVLAFFFHWEVQIIDALTLEPASNYSVKINLWRIVFEPVLGLLLYFNRSLYPLQELPISFLWIMGFYLLGNLAIIFKVSNRTPFVLRFLRNFPLVIGLCFTVFIGILFLPLPNNTIVNNSLDEVLVTTHAHTEFSHDGLISQEKMWDWHERNGFDAFFITDHANHEKTLEFSVKQRNGQWPSVPMVLVGQEHSGSNHMSLLGLNGKFKTKDKSDSLIVNLVHKHGGAVIVNHWFDGKGKHKEFYTALGVDGFEIENIGKELYYDRAIFEELQKYCVDNKLLMVGGLDFHGYGRACGIYNAFKIPQWRQMNVDDKEKSILEVLRNRNQNKLRVLMYYDRPFYAQDNLIFQPFITLFTYFRTLNGYQVLSWLLWLVVFQLLWNRYRKSVVVINKIWILVSGASALFLLILGVYYWVRGNAVKGFSKVFSEYSSILLLVGGIFMGYSLWISYRYYKKRI